MAEDYLGAGLFDRAEKLFAELRESTTLAEAALEKLVSIYEREQEWQKAIDAQRKLEMLRGSKSSQVAHYYCELAELARAAGDRALAREHLRNTVRSESGALRGTLIRATLAREEQDYAQAIPLYEQVSRADRHFITEVLPPLLECYRAADQLPEFDAYLEGARRERCFVASRLRLRRDHRQLARLDRARGRRRALRVRAPVLANLVNAAELRALPTEQRSARSSESPTGCARLRWRTRVIAARIAATARNDSSGIARAASSGRRCGRFKACRSKPCSRAR